ncbi:MAG TPA: FAD-linked oxidase C-terminal domain-containing protein [Bacteroidia bacterium]|nr:FAD-linked oxidase C-terminal domain-containing protein [Bacteroidia bacterium]
MSYTTLNSKIIEQLKTIVGDAYVIVDSEKLSMYGRDETEDLLHLPEVIIKPRTAQEISEVMKLANEKNIAVTPRGAGTGLSGGALPVHGGISLSMERFNEILFIDERNLQATVEPGVINEVFQNVVKEKGLFYPPDPASKGSCFLGGNVAESSGGPKCVKYGTTKDYILNLEVVLPTGEIIYTGANTLKNSTGYNLTQLMVGSEGTLGIVTKIMVRLIPLPKYDMLMLVPFRSLDQACEAVSEVFRAGFTPSALELMERDALDWAGKYVESTVVKLEDDIYAHLLIEVDGNDNDVLMKEMEAIADVMTKFDISEILFADTAAQKQELWKLRRKINEAVKMNAISKEQDTVVPRAELAKLVGGIKNIGVKYEFKSICYGHAGDGNLHVRMLKGNLTDEQWNGSYIKKAITEIFTLCHQLGGTISGEHGIGLIQQEYMNIVFAEKALDVQRQIKRVFDPKNILNPGKMFNRV